MFAEVKATLIIPYVGTLHPYIKSSNENPDVLCHTAAILELVVPTIENPNIHLVEEIEQDLATLIERGKGVKVISSCSKALCHIVHTVTHNSKLLESVVYKFCEYPRMCHLKISRFFLKRQEAAY